jgi:polar amino acid transport system substrate-binding protein
MVPAVTLTAAREKMYSMVTYDIDGYSLATIKAEPSLGKTYASMCGHTIADELGDVAIPVMNAWSSKCKASGNKGITVLTFPSESAAELSVQSGRTQYVAGGISTLGYLAKTSKAGTWRLTGPTFLTGLTAIALSKGSSLAPYIVQAINKLIANGTYGHIMEENGMAANEITHSALSPKV